MRSIKLKAIILMFVICFFRHSAFAALTLTEAEKLALEKDPMVSKLLAESRALSQKAIADGELKDPRLKLAVSAIPLDTWDMQQEGMTQEKIGIQQGFPRGDTLRLKKERTYAMARGKRIEADLERKKILQGVRIAYQDVVHQRLAYQIVLESQTFFEQLVEIVEFRYTSGKAKRQDFLQASLALSRVADRLLKIKNKEDLARAALSKWIPRAAAFGALSTDFPEPPPLPERSNMRDRLPQHPSVGLADVDIHTQGLDLLRAKAQYKPGWMVEADYGYRQGNNPDKSSRSDFLSFMVSMDLPLFSENRQDRVQNARRIQVQAAEFGRDNRLRILASDLEANDANYTRLGERLQLFSTQLVPEAQQYTETTMISYQSRVADLTDVVRAHLAEQKVRMDLLEIRYKRLVAQAKLRFILGDKE